MNRTAVLRQRWQALAVRERRLLGTGIALIACALFWELMLAPALRTLSEVAAEHARLDSQMQQMQTLQARAHALQAQPRMQRDNALRALQTATKQNFGDKAQIQNMGEAVNVAVHGVDAVTLTQWLAQARTDARATVREAHLTRSNATGTATSNVAHWDGSFVMTLPLGQGETR